MCAPFFSSFFVDEKGCACVPPPCPPGAVNINPCVISTIIICRCLLCETMGAILSTESGLLFTILRIFRRGGSGRNSSEITITIEDIQITTGARHLNLSSQPVDNDLFAITLQAHQQPDNVEKLSLVGKHSVTHIPVQIGNYVNLETVILSNNHIEVVPWAIVYLAKLKILDLSYNKLKELPRTIGSVTKLEDLNLEGNLLTRLPTELLDLKFLRKLNVSKNFKLFPSQRASMATDIKAILKLLEMRSKRKDVWEGCTPWMATLISEPSASHVAVPNLHEICVSCIMKYSVDFLSPKFVPPVLKSTLTEVEENYKNGINLAKCSNCNKYFSTKETFERHLC